jgi:Beta-galactosidase
MACPSLPSLGVAATLALLLVAAGAGRADDLLVDFAQGFDFQKVEARDVKVSEARHDDTVALRMDTGHQQEWPGITLPAPQGHWDLSKYEFLALDVANVGADGVEVCCRVDNPGADGVRNCLTDRVTLKPGEKGTIRVDLPVGVVGLQGEPVQLFGMRGYPLQFNSANVIGLLVFVPRPQADHAFEIANIRVGGTRKPDEVQQGSFLPLIDEFGQYVHRDWPGKTHSLEELRARIAEEEKDLAAHAGPADWDQYGGWAGGPKLEATGRFRVAKQEGKWWFVDPEGHLFFSQGIDCVNMWEGSTPIDERETWYAWLPARDSEFGPFFGQARALHGHYAGKTVSCFDFGRANALRKYGPAWQDTCGAVSHRRLRSWGLNTIGNWSDRSIGEQRKTPYVATVGFGGKLLEGSAGYWGKFRDVFDPSFEESVRKSMAGEKGKSSEDPWCLGYFVDNEIAWGDELSLALAALASPPGQVAKTVFLDDLKAKYGTIDELNAQWGTQHASWDALLQSQEPPDRQKAHDDLLAFSKKTADRYFETVRKAVKEISPQGLYLGCRFAWANPVAVAAAAKYCDVVSYNLYRRSVADFRLPLDADVPLIIGEFHFGALDRGMFHTGLVPVADQAARAAAYKDYVQGCLRHPQFVGCHWFKYMDESTTGRPLDEENYQIGFVDIADTPYPETIAACREVGYGMYEYRLKAK